MSSSRLGAPYEASPANAESRGPLTVPRMTSLDQTPSPSAPVAGEPHAPSSRKVDDGQCALTANPRHTAADTLQFLSAQLPEAGDIERMRLLADIVDEATASLNDAVRSAREAGRSWQVIADAVKTTRQAAHARWSKWERDSPVHQDEPSSTHPHLPPAEETRATRSGRVRIGSISVKGALSVSVKRTHRR